MTVMVIVAVAAVVVVVCDVHSYDVDTPVCPRQKHLLGRVVVEITMSVAITMTVGQGRV